jgi:hypothetical protein
MRWVGLQWPSKPAQFDMEGRSLPVYEQMEDALITLRMEPQQFTALCAGFGAADDPDAPIDPSLLAQVRSALDEAKATALPGLPILSSSRLLD